MISLVSESFAREYKAKGFISTGCLVCFCFYFMIIVLPFLLIIASDGFNLHTFNIKRSMG